MRHLIFASLFGISIGCGTDVEPPGTDPEPTPRTTWYQDVAPIVSEHCMGCHQESGIAPFSLATYEDVMPIADQLIAAIESGVMPPFSVEPTDDCTPTHGWKEDPRLTDAEKATIVAWIADGREAGTPVEIALPAVPELTGKTHSLTPAPYVTSGEADEFICFLLDPATTTPTWLTGWHVRPGNPAVVHHAVVSTLPAALMDDARSAIGVGNSFPCSAAAGVPGSFIVGAWAPGGQAYDSGSTGIRIGAGDGIIVQIHYHPGGETAEPDATTLDLRLQTTRPEAEYALRAFGNVHGAPGLQPGPYDPPTGPKFEIPPGVADGMETMWMTLPPGSPTLKVMTAFPHMHYVGVGLSAWVERAAPRAGEPTRECLVNINRWSFDWQRQYGIDAPIDQLPVVRAGDRIELRCKYDNTLGNPYVQRALAEQNLDAPQLVHLGEQTLDEMCISLFAVINEAAQ
jgi:hypothetical protein